MHINLNFSDGKIASGLEWLGLNKILQAHESFFIIWPLLYVKYLYMLVFQTCSSELFNTSHQLGHADLYLQTRSPLLFPHPAGWLQGCISTSFIWIPKRCCFLDLLCSNVHLSTLNFIHHMSSQLQSNSKSLWNLSAALLGFSTFSFSAPWKLPAENRTIKALILDSSETYFNTPSSWKVSFSTMMSSISNCYFCSQQKQGGDPPCVQCW